MSDKNHRRVIFSQVKILGDHYWLHDQAIVVENDKITAIVPAEMIKHHLPASHYQFTHECFLTPGFIDLHVHGTHGHDVMDGTQCAIETISKSLAKEGVTSFLATTMTAPIHTLEFVLEMLGNACATMPYFGLLGIHLEGPFIAKEKLGAQSNFALTPDVSLFARWLDLARNTIKCVTVAPELPQAFEFIDFLQQKKIVAAIGHTHANYAETMNAIRAGAQHATHLFNAMELMHQREPGAASALLLSEQVKAELIVDGVHLHPAMVDLAYRLKQKAGLLLVTDAMRAKCLGDGQFELGGQTVTVKQGVARLANGTLAGSTLMMNQAIKNFVAFTGCTLIDALTLATINPARVLGIHDRFGTLKVGKYADIVVMNGQLDILLTMRHGKIIYDREKCHATA